MEQKFTWSIFGVVLAIFSLLLPAIYSKKAELTFDVINQVNVLDIKQSLKDVTILFQGNNIYEKNQNLRIYQFKIINSGGVNITQKDYDQEEPWGFDVVGGAPIEVRMLGASSDYLLKKTNPLISGNAINFNKVIFDKNSYFMLEVLVLHSKGFEPKFSPLGKIAGIARINFENTWSQKERPNFLQQMFSGGMLINFLRFLVSIVLFITLLAMIAYTTDKVGGFFRSRKRRKTLKNISEFSLDDQYGKILSKIYLDGGDHAIQRAYGILKDETRLSLIFKKLNLTKQNSRVTDKEFNYLLNQQYVWGTDLMDDFIKGGFIKEETDGSIYVDPKLLSRCKAFLNVFRKIKNIKKEK